MGESHRTLVTIPNRYAFVDRIDGYLQRNRRASLLLIDVVRFSDVSTSFGHEVGDRILLEIANRIQRLFGHDALLGRVSGDIFGLLIPGWHGERQLRHHYNHLVEHFKAPIYCQDHAFLADFNVGAVPNAPENGDIIKLLSRAEGALKQAKENRYDNLCIARLEDKVRGGRALALKADLQRAMQRDELELYFQPKVRLRDLKITGAECLLRWNHPMDGVLFPGALIEAAESYNMMNELGYWTMTQAFKHALRFRAQGIDVPLSLNMSPTQLYDVNFIPTLRQLSESYGIDLSSFELELTEDIALSNSLMVKRQLSQAKALGARIAVDDFGKGYSNLAYIRDLSIDTLKIDKTFVMGLNENPVNMAIVQAAQLIAASMECEIVAEGIEDLEQLHVLRDSGLRTGQGYLFSRAVPEAEFIELYHQDLSVGSSLAHVHRTG
ncbi:bifunctional diguanylate cyclase/phosphodiesterase [Aestuariibacter halophilus]|uniref:Bifunctional diguanylate cyclase/phosphodiesterase n=2 Tax=Fluctibacter halophilus TaxID=226011 RepID=A0ABS8G5Y5_9ALTE|nr:bifunctional diguanylate cyclase/phosphodiesterase [Aestuariibacter halophilus]MCC2616002.1 bifunctional diguanylate cyclase/phosphodiesterase [Aestuariibacter halophilus]